MNKNMNADAVYQIFVEQLAFEEDDLLDWLHSEKFNVRSIEIGDDETCRDLAKRIQILRMWASMRDVAKDEIDRLQPPTAPEREATRRSRRDRWSDTTSEEHMQLAMSHWLASPEGPPA